jgi:hypothetical protein
MEMPSGGILGRLKSFTPSRPLVSRVPGFSGVPGFARESFPRLKVSPSVKSHGRLKAACSVGKSTNRSNH